MKFDESKEQQDKTIWKLRNNVRILQGRCYVWTHGELCAHCGMKPTCGSRAKKGREENSGNKGIRGGEIS